MQNMKWLFAAVLVVCGSLGWSQAKPDDHPTLTKVVDGRVSGVEGEFVSAADAMPEGKYSFVPTAGEFKGVRTFAQQVKHVAAVNYMIAGSILEAKPPVDLGSENGPDAITSKADIMNFLKGSFAYLHKAVATINDQNAIGQVKSPFGEGKVTRLGIAMIAAGHCFDHYGQMVVYLRMNGIVPPASR